MTQKKTRSFKGVLTHQLCAGPPRPLLREISHDVYIFQPSLYKRYQHFIMKPTHRKLMDKESNIYLNAAALQDHICRQFLPKINTAKLSLAQKLGLVPSPPKPLSKDEWQLIEQIQVRRQEDVSEQLCPICLEKFKMQEHTILSCSHIFHKICLESFERVSKLKNCPICRKQDYEKKQYLKANQQYKLASVIKIQSLFRAYRARINFYEHMIAFGYKTTSSRLRRRLLFYKLSKVSDKMQKRVQLQQLMASKAVEKLSSEFQQKKEQMEGQLLKIRMLKSVDERPQGRQLQELVDWNKVRQIALERKETECTICYQSMINTKVYLLNCSHMFHSNCIAAFERYSIGVVHTCPLCRGSYQKQHFQLKV